MFFRNFLFAIFLSCAGFACVAPIEAPQKETVQEYGARIPPLADYEILPEDLPKQKEYVHPCEKVEEVAVAGKKIQLWTWCNPEPFIYKGYPSPIDRETHE